MNDTVASAPNAGAAFALALFGELARAGLRHVCVCPGSRSAPLVAAALATEELRVWSHLDERSAAYFALGLARGGAGPAAVVCTSGTAVANLLPAVAEASTARVPLLLLTADRPPELRDWGAGQTIDQLRLFGSHARWFVEVAVPSALPERLRYARALACRAVARACQRPRGPVHLNLPFREPLEPSPVAGAVDAELLARDPLAATGRPPGPFTRWRAGAARLDRDETAQLARRLARAERGAIVCGPLAEVEAERIGAAAARLAQRLGWPLFADALSTLRSGPGAAGAPLVVAYDTWLRSEAVASGLSPDCVLRIGDTPTSKALRRWLAGPANRHTIVIDPDAVGHDPDHVAAEAVVAEPAPWLEAVADRLDEEPAAPGSRAWLERILALDRCAVEVAARIAGEEPALLEPALVAALAEELPEGARLFVSNSMPVRDVDAFLPVRSRPLRVLGQRGANGIDGVVSAALGAAAAAPQPLVLLVGDLALAHDLGGLLAARRHRLHAVLLVIENGGGGIFSYLPVARYAEQVGFAEHFLAPTGLALERVASLFELGYTRVDSLERLRKALAAALAAPGTTLIEVPVDRERSVAHHRAIWETTAREAQAHGLADARGGPP